MRTVTEDEQEVETFCLREHPRLLGALRLYCGNAALARELAHLALVKVVDDWPRIRSMSAADLRLLRVAFELADSSKVRAKAARQAGPRAVGGGAALAGGDSAEARDLRLMMSRALASLPRRERAALVLRAYADCSLAETAAVMGVAPGVVASLTAAALHALRARMGEYWPSSDWGAPMVGRAANLEDEDPQDLRTDDHAVWRRPEHNAARPYVGPA
jgi:DNA-directed RNA polymerase specialized sigma24 family protein